MYAILWRWKLFSIGQESTVALYSKYILIFLEIIEEGNDKWYTYKQKRLIKNTFKPILSLNLTKPFS